MGGQRKIATELFNTWYEEWNEIDDVWEPQEIHKIGCSKDWFYFIWAQERSLRLIRVDSDTMHEMNSKINK